MNTLIYILLLLILLCLLYYVYSKYIHHRRLNQSVYHPFNRHLNIYGKVQTWKQRRNRKRKL